MSNLELLEQVLGETDAKELFKLTSNYDKYIMRFKKSVNKLLESHGYEIKLGVAFVKKDEQKQE